MESNGYVPNDKDLINEKKNPPRLARNKSDYSSVQFKQVKIPKEIMRDIGNVNPSLECLVEGFMTKYEVAYKLLFDCESILCDMLEQIRGSELEIKICDFTGNNEVIKVANQIRKYERESLPF